MPPAPYSPAEAAPVDGGWVSWRPMMAAAVARTTGPVLELGAGDGSTPWLHDLLAGSDRYLQTLDGDREWAERFAPYREARHGIRCVPDWDKEPLGPWWCRGLRWGAVLVDHAPGERRVVEIRRLAHRADVLVLHDSEPVGGGNYGYKEIWGLFKYVRHDAPAGKDAAWATAVSNFIDVREW